MTEHLDAEALLYLLSLPQGRKVLWDILKVAGIYDLGFVADDRDSTALKAGMRNIGLIIYKDCMTISPDLTAMMLKEQGNYDNREHRDSNADSGRDDNGADPSSGGDELDFRNGLGGFRTDLTGN